MVVLNKRERGDGETDRKEREIVGLGRFFLGMPNARAHTDNGFGGQTGQHSWQRKVYSLI